MNNYIHYASLNFPRQMESNSITTCIWDTSIMSCEQLMVKIIVQEVWNAWELTFIVIWHDRNSFRFKLWAKFVLTHTMYIRTRALKIVQCGVSTTKNLIKLGAPPEEKMCLKVNENTNIGSIPSVWIMTYMGFKSLLLLQCIVYHF